MITVVKKTVMSVDRKTARLLRGLTGAIIDLTDATRELTDVLRPPNALPQMTVTVSNFSDKGKN